jgi:hypothetical protein
MDIQRDGVSVPLSETSTESVAPKEAPGSQTISQPFQNDSIVSYTPPGLDLGETPTTPATQQMSESLADQWRQNADPLHPPPDPDDLLDNILEAKRATAKSVLNNIR